MAFAQPAGGTTPAPVAAWSDFAIRVTVPDGAITGPVTVTTASGRRLSAVVQVLPRVPSDPDALTWQSRTPFPSAPIGVGVAAAEVPAGGVLTVTLYAAGGAEQIANRLVPDSGVYVARAQPGGAIGPWTRQLDRPDAARSRALPAPRAFAAVAVATRHNSRFTGRVLYVIGGIDSSGRAQASVLAADVTADSVASRFTPIEPLPAPVVGALAVVRRGRIYVMGGADSAGHPRRTVFVGRVAVDGHIDGWYLQPSLTAPLSLVSGFVAGGWAAGPTLLPAPRSQFATLDLGDALVLVGGIYSGAAGNGAETLTAALTGDALGSFTVPAGGNTIAGSGGGTLVGPAGVTWRDADGTHRGMVIGGTDLLTGQRKSGVWGF